MVDNPLLSPTEKFGLYELRWNRDGWRIFGPEAELDALARPTLCHKPKDFPRLETTIAAASWLEAKRALGIPLTSVQTRFIEGKLTHFELFGRFWSVADMKDINRGKQTSRYTPARSANSDDALLAALEARFAEEDEAARIRGDGGQGPGPGDRLDGGSGCPLQGGGTRVFLGGGADCRPEGSGGPHSELRGEEDAEGEGEMT